MILSFNTTRVQLPLLSSSKALSKFVNTSTEPKVDGTNISPERLGGLCFSQVIPSQYKYNSLEFATIFDTVCTDSI
jgi:hypothetical protein